MFANLYGHNALNSLYLTEISIFLTLQYLSGHSLVFTDQYSCGPSPFVVFLQLEPSAGERSNKKCANNIQYVYNPVCGRDTAVVLPLLSTKMPRKVQRNWHPLCNVLHTALVCHPRYLKACVQRFVIRLLCLPFHSTRALYCNAKHLLLSITPLRMFACRLFICVCSMR